MRSGVMGAVAARLQGETTMTRVRKLGFKALEMNANVVSGPFQELRRSLVTLSADKRAPGCVQNSLSIKLGGLSRTVDETTLELEHIMMKDAAKLSEEGTERRDSAGSHRGGWSDFSGGASSI